MTDEEAKTTQEVVKLGTRALETLEKGGAYLDRVLGTLPVNAVGIAGDWIGEQRVRIRAKLRKRTRELLEKWNVTEPVEISPSLAIPLLTAAQDEAQDDLQELWARLIAAAMAPARSRRVRPQFITVLKQFAPLDAVVLQWLRQNTAEMTDTRGHLSKLFKVTTDEIQVSFDNLRRLECILDTSSPSVPIFSPFGRELMRACSD